MNLKPFFLILLVACVTVQAQVPEKRAYTYLEQMDEIMKSVPGYWKTSLEDIETTAARVKKGTTRLLCMSAGNRPVYGMFYGKPNELKRSANLSSAMGAGNMKHYADKSAQDYKPTLFLVGAVHGGELEGTAALMNLVTVLETGKDLAGKEHPDICASAEKINFIIIPCANPDGRARVPLPSMVGLDYESFRYLSQGTWVDGTLTDWPGCKTIHPILEAVEHLGSYFNDDGINMMHDFFFTNPAVETKTILQTAENYAPDFTVLFHGGANGKPHLAGVGYLFEQEKEKIRAFQRFIKEEYAEENFSLGGNGVEESNTKSFNLTSAITHVCGTPALTFESNQGLDYLEEGNPSIVKYTYDEIYRHHMLTIEGLCKFLLR